jgi:hypothetical protein
MAALDRTRLIGPLRSFFRGMRWGPRGPSFLAAGFVVSPAHLWQLPAAANEKAVRMRSILGVSVLILAPVCLGCVSTPHPQPIVQSKPIDKSRDVAIDPPTAGDSVGQTVADKSSSASFSSRFTKLFGRSDGSDRMPLPRSDQSPDGGDSSQRDLGRDF